MQMRANLHTYKTVYCEFGQHSKELLLGIDKFYYCKNGNPFVMHSYLWAAQYGKINDMNVNF